MSQRIQARHRLNESLLCHYSVWTLCFQAAGISQVVSRSTLIVHCVYIHTYIHTFIHTFIHTYIHTYIHSHIHSYIHTYTHTYIHTYIHTHTYIYTYIHIYIHTHIHTYVHTYVSVAEWLAWLTSNCGRIGAIGSSPSNGLRPKK